MHAHVIGEKCVLIKVRTNYLFLRHIITRDGSNEGIKRYMNLFLSQKDTLFDERGKKDE